MKKENKVLDWYRTHKYVWLAAYVPAYLIMFFAVEHLVTDNYWVSYIPFDDLIPFAEVFIVPYCMWYPFLLVVGLYLLFFDGDNFKRYMYYMMIGFTFCLVFCAVFPNGQDLRPGTFERDNIFTRLTSMIYAADTNTNVLPSMHVVGVADGAFAMLRSRSLKRKWPKVLTVVIGVLICVSTVFVKQHSVLDIFAAVILCIPLSYFIFLRKPKKKAEKRALR